MLDCIEIETHMTSLKLQSRYFFSELENKLTKSQKEKEYNETQTSLKKYKMSLTNRTSNGSETTK